MSARARLCALAICLVGGASLLAAGCGDDAAEVPEGAVAVVGDASISGAELDRAMARFRAQAEMGNQTFPEEGTDAFDQARQQALESLVFQRVVNFEARDCGTPCRITDADITAEIERIVESDFQGSRKNFDDFLTSAKYTLPDARRFLRADLQQKKLVDHVTRGVRFTDADARTYYDENRDQFQTPAGRTPSHILVKTKAEADAIRAEVTPENFAALARDRSQDPGSAERGGLLGALQPGTFLPEFEKAALALANGEISEPVETQYGWHIITVDVTPAQTTTFAQARAGIKTQQLGQRRQEEFNEWGEGVLEKWRGRTEYADPALKPPEPDAGTATDGAATETAPATAPPATTP